jgi:CheY-like chemotaxis protein/HPt (histidine-containing phosphotransfer) domain-containing protein
MDLKKSKVLLLALLIGAFSTLSAAPLGAMPKMQTQKSEKAADGKNIVLGRFGSRQDADLQLSSLLDFIDSNSTIANLEMRHGFDYAVKDENGSFILSIEPFVEDDVLHEVFAIVKERFPKAYEAECKGCVSEAFIQARSNQKERELLDNAVAQEQNSIPVIVKEEIETVEIESTPETEPAEEKNNIIGLLSKIEYVLYGLGALALFILLYLLAKKPAKPLTKEQKEDKAPTEKVEEETPSPSKEERELDETKVEVTPFEEAAAAMTGAAVEEKGKGAEPIPTTPKIDKNNHKLREPNSEISNISKSNFEEFAGLRLLIAEDNLINQKVIVGLLKESGIIIKIANDGQECLDILQEDPNYQIILMDAHMPRVDGLEATRQIRANPAYDHITVMALSGDTGADDIRKMREAGMEEQLEKPLKIAALYQALYCYFDPNATVDVAEEAVIHLDNSLGLEMLGGDLELYQEILSEFQTLYHDSDEKIELWLKYGDEDKAKALLLDIKGIGESIGTAELTQTAEEFREAIIDGKSDQYPKLLKRYRTQLHSILADIAEV